MEPAAHSPDAKLPGHLGRLAGGTVTPALKAFFATARRVVFVRGDTLIADGDSADTVLDVLTGELILARHGSDGRRQVLGFVGSSHFVGMSPGRHYALSLTALSDGVALRYDRKALDSALEAEPKFAAAFRHTMELVLASAHDHLFALGQRSAVERLSAFLLHQRLWQARFGPDAPREPSLAVRLPMTRTDIGDFLGLTIETVSRAFTTLRKSNAISLPNANLAVIRDLGVLRKLAGARDFANLPSIDD